MAVDVVLAVFPEPVLSCCEYGVIHNELASECAPKVEYGDVKLTVGVDAETAEDLISERICTRAASSSETRRSSV